MRWLILLASLSLSGTALAATSSTATDARAGGDSALSVVVDARAALVDECTNDSQCTDAEKSHCCCGLTGSGRTVCRCEASCPE